MPTILTTFGETYDVMDYDGGIFNVGPSVTLDINCPVQADPHIYRLNDFPSYQHARSLHLVVLGHATFSQTWKDPYTLVPLSKLKGVDVNIIPWYDTQLEEWAIKSIVTKNVEWTGNYPKEIAIRVQLYIPQVVIE